MNNNLFLVLLFVLLAIPLLTLSQVSSPLSILCQYTKSHSHSLSADGRSRRSAPQCDRGFPALFAPQKHIGCLPERMPEGVCATIRSIDHKRIEGWAKNMEEDAQLGTDEHWFHLRAMSGPLPGILLQLREGTWNQPPVNLTSKKLIAEQAAGSWRREIENSSLFSQIFFIYNLHKIFEKVQWFFFFKSHGLVSPPFLLFVTVSWWTSSVNFRSSKPWSHAGGVGSAVANGTFNRPMIDLIWSAFS
jgi:hypothetical protein